MDWVAEFFDGPYWNADYQVVGQDGERTDKEVGFIVSELKLDQSKRVLDLACGNGRHALRVAGHVASVTGFDRTRQYLDNAGKQAEMGKITNLELTMGDMRELDYFREFDAAYNYFTAWGYYSDEENFNVLRRVYHALKPGGRFLLEIIHRDNVIRRYQPHDWSQREDGTLMLYDRKFDLATGRNHTTYRRIRDGKELSITIDHFMPTGDALVRWFRKAGFIDIRIVSAPDGGELTLDSNRMAVIGTTEPH